MTLYVQRSTLNFQQTSLHNNDQILAGIPELLRISNVQHELALIVLVERVAASGVWSLDVSLLGEELDLPG